jgi:hypothetical protein
MDLVIILAEADQQRVHPQNRPAFRSRSFSFSSSFSRFTWSVFKPPNSFRHR